MGPKMESGETANAVGRRRVWGWVNTQDGNHERSSSMNGTGTPTGQFNRSEGSRLCLNGTLNADEIGYSESNSNGNYPSLCRIGTPSLGSSRPICLRNL
jgi:hypothetical protein